MSVSVSDSPQSPATRNASGVARPSERHCALAVLLCLCLFLAATTLSMWLYPGGNWLDRTAAGHRFFANFFCDLTQPLSLSGVQNRWGAALAQFGMLSFAGALAAFFWLLPHHFAPATQARRGVRALGLCTVLTFVAVPLTPSERFGNLHGVLALGSAALGIVAALCAVWALAASHRRARVLAAWGGLVLAVAGFDAGLFAYHLSSRTPLPLIIPAAQKFAGVLLCTWMLAVAWPWLAREGSAFTRRG